MRLRLHVALQPSPADSTPTGNFFIVEKLLHRYYSYQHAQEEACGRSLRLYRHVTPQVGDPGEAEITLSRLKIQPEVEANISTVTNKRTRLTPVTAEFHSRGNQKFLTRHKGGKKRKSFELLIRRTTLGANFRL